MCDCRWNPERADSGLRKLLYPQPLRACLVNLGQETVDSFKESVMGESIYSPTRGISNDGSDFSDTSVSIACSTSTAPNPYDDINAYNSGPCHGCSNRYASESPRRRRRRVVARSLILDHGYSKSPQYNLSDSGLMLRCDRNHPESESSSSECSNITPVRVPRRKPKSHRRSMPPQYYPVNPRPVVPNKSVPYAWVSILCYLALTE